MSLHLNARANNSCVQNRAQTISCFDYEFVYWYNWGGSVNLTAIIKTKPRQSAVLNQNSAIGTIDVSRFIWQLYSKQSADNQLFFGYCYKVIECGDAGHAWHTKRSSASWFDHALVCHAFGRQVLTGCRHLHPFIEFCRFVKHLI